jgi:hypothetical protein
VRLTWFVAPPSWSCFSAILSVILALCSSAKTLAALVARGRLEGEAAASDVEPLQ